MAPPNYGVKMEQQPCPAKDADAAESDSTDGSPKPAAESSVASLLLTLIQTQKDLTEAIAALADSNYAMAQAMAETSESREDDEDEVPQAMSTKR